MKYNPDCHHRQSIRLQGYDYAEAGAYFVSLCTQHRECLFGEIVDGAMQLNDPGRMIRRWYYALEKKYPDIRCGALVCMPNHIHFIIVNVGADLCVRPLYKKGEHIGSPLQHARPSNVRSDPHDGRHMKQGEHIGSPLQRVVQWFKTMTTNDYIRGVKQHGWRPFLENYGNAIIGNTWYATNLN
ncbi:MAG: transposase [Candidatus Competibacteraceae bacterium]